MPVKRSASEIIFKTYKSERLQESTNFKVQEENISLNTST